jgi:hypothetical protein
MGVRARRERRAVDAVEDMVHELVVANDAKLVS